MKITINGDEQDFDGETISHEKICELANRPVHASVTYSGPRHGDSRREGLTYAGKSVQVEDGMIFNCVVTGNA